MKKRDFVTTTGPLCAGAPRSAAWGGCGAGDVKAWGELGAALRVPLSTHQSPVYARVLVRCRPGTVLPRGLVLSWWDTAFWRSLEEVEGCPLGCPLLMALPSPQDAGFKWASPSQSPEEHR